MIDDTLLEAEEKMDKAVTVAQEDFSNIRTGRVTPQVFSKITAEAVVVHGDYDPHPANGVAVPLSKYLTDFHFILLPRCGHKPWIERQARDLFYTVLNNELAI